MKIKMLAFAIGAAVTPSVFAQDTADSIEEMLILGQEFTVISESGSRLGLSLREIPATVDVIDGDAIRNRFDLSITDVVTRSAGVTNTAGVGNGGTNICSRGFCGQEAVTKLYDGNAFFIVSGTITFPFDTWAVDRVEVLKGPASNLYGIGGIAGAYNVVPKQPSEEFDADIRLTVGENNEQFFGVSLNGAITESLSGRIDYSQSESDNWVDRGESESDMFALALAWQAHEDLTFTLRHDAGDQSPMRYFGIPHIDGTFNEDWVEVNFGVSDGQVEYDDTFTRLIADWVVSDRVSFTGEIFSLDTDRYWQNIERYSYDDETGLIQRDYDFLIRHELQQAGARGNFVVDSNLGDIGWKSSVGLEFTSADYTYTSNFGGFPQPDSLPDNYIDPDDFVPGLWSDVSNTVGALHRFSDVSQMALYGETQLRFTDQFALVGGFRYDYIDTDFTNAVYEDDGTRNVDAEEMVNQTVDPLMLKLGVVYDLNADTSIYAQVSTGETHNSGDIVRVVDRRRSGDTVGTEQLELGVKQSLFGERLSWNLAVFDIARNNMTIVNPDDPTDFEVIDERRSQGVEVGINYAQEAFTVYGNAAYVDAEEDTATATSQPVDFVAEITVNAGMSYGLSENLLLRADYRFVDDRPRGDIFLPSYSVVDMSLGYQINENARVTLNAANIFDELYASSENYGQWLVGKPRTLSLTLDLDF